MNVRLLVDGLVRQTTVLIAQISTSAGVRAPLAHVADEVFRDLALAIEEQGVGRKVVADMFGLALRSYQKKLRRLQESSTERNRTLWQAVLEFLKDGSKTRVRLLERFRGDGEREVGAVLNDLVSSGMVYCTGRGDLARYGLTSQADQLAFSETRDQKALENVVWVTVFLERACVEPELTRVLRTDADETARAVETLVAEGRLRRTPDGALAASNVLIPVGATEGWEAAILDHFRAVTTTIAGRLSGRDAGDDLGGTTLTFSVHAGHPYEERVRRLLGETREKLHALWDEVSAYNRSAEPPEDAARITFYFGQVTEADPEPGRPEPREPGDLEE